MSRMKAIGACMAMMLLFAHAGIAADYVAIAGGTFASALPDDAKAVDVVVAPFQLRSEPVTNAEFLAFVMAHPEWRRDRVAPLFAEQRYLSQWSAADEIGGPSRPSMASGALGLLPGGPSRPSMASGALGLLPGGPSRPSMASGALGLLPGAGALPDQPVTRVSWFAAEAFCESEDARLPLWNEWEFAAAADATRTDARGDPAWRESILSWYAQPSNKPLAAIGGAANVYGIRDLQSLVWEWVDDFSALLVAGDSRDQGDPDRLKFCGAGALNLRDKENYAVLMRIAMLSALKANDTTANLGFRCAKAAQ